MNRIDGQDVTPWHGDDYQRAPAASTIPEHVHELASVGRAFLCAACPFATFSVREAAGHLAASQWREIVPFHRSRP